MIGKFKPGSKELAKVLHYYGMLDEGSSEFKIVCPFHEDINASMLISMASGSFYCFGCNVSGDASTFVKLMNPKIDDLKAIIKYYRILKSKRTKKVVFSRTPINKPTNEQALVEAEDYYFGLKTINWNKEKVPERKYMKQRGFLYSSLTKCKAKLTYNTSYPIIFPMFDMGVFKGWVCRTTDKEIEKKRKYLYNTGFSRRNTLVGTYGSKTVMLVEGYMDWLKMKELGVKNVAAILGWKVTASQITKLKEQGVKRIVSALDNDTCGEKGTEYLKQFFEVIRFQFPEGIKDPGDMDKKSFKKAKELTRRLING